MDLPQMFNLAGRTALVTGSSRGIGRSIALALAHAGANVVIHGSHPGAKLDETVVEANLTGARAVGIPGDIGNPGEIEALVSRSRAALGSIDILVLNASTQAYVTFEEFQDEEFQREYNTNVRAAMLLIQAVIPEMKQRQWGRILSIGSVNQWKPSPRLSIYASTKAAQTNLIMNCARQYSQYGITANNLAPGVITTDRNREALGDESTRNLLLGSIPAGRFGSADDCAGLALLLCSDAGSYITGADIPVTGGMHL